uniref:Uncharacterized protein n=1 Tax=viral metagenome TaxID=1070528 RepID=A0A6M3XH10_9ZZZZ
MTTIQQACSAISGRNVVKFNYEGYTRVVEPHLLGEKTSGSIALSAWQVEGYSESGSYPPWRNYTLDKITGFAHTGETFIGSRPGYNPNDKTMLRIICRI